MKQIVRPFLMLVAVLFLTASVSDANMKKAKVGAGGHKGFSFSSTQDGPCTVSVIYDTVTSDLDTAIGLSSTGDLVCAGLSAQDNFDSCTANLPAGDYDVVVVSFRGASVFRAVVNCGSQEFIASTGDRAHGVELKEIQLDSNGKKILDQLKSIQKAKK